MKKFDVVISFQQKKKKLNKLVLQKGINDKEVLTLSRQLDRLQNQLYK